MPQNNPGSGATENDAGMLAMAIVGIAIVAGAVYFLQQPMKDGILAIRHAEVWLLSPFNEHFGRLDRWLSKEPYEVRTWEETKILTVLVGEWLRWPIGFFSLWVAYLSYMKLS